jgi:hypothetical protein
MQIQDKIIGNTEAGFDPIGKPASNFPRAIYGKILLGK